jgi:hypothetical protein
MRPPLGRVYAKVRPERRVDSYGNEVLCRGDYSPTVLLRMLWFNGTRVMAGCSPAIDTCVAGGRRY